MVKVPPGMGLAFRCDRVHAGSEYKKNNFRFHFVIMKKYHRHKGNIVVTPEFCPFKGCGADFHRRGDLNEHMKWCQFKE